MLTGNAPLTAVQLLWVNMIMDTLGALALATEPPNDDLMKRLPVGRKGNFISNVMWRNILGQSLYQFSIIWFLQTRGKAAFHLDGPDSDLILNTLIFNAFVFCQVIMLFRKYLIYYCPLRRYWSIKHITNFSLVFCSYILCNLTHKVLFCFFYRFSMRSAQGRWRR